MYVQSKTFDDQSNLADASFRPRAYPASRARALRGAGPPPVPVPSLKKPLIIRYPDLSFENTATADLQDQPRLTIPKPKPLRAIPTRVFPQGPPGFRAAVREVPMARVVDTPKMRAAIIVQGQQPLAVTRKPKKRQQGLRGLGQGGPLMQSLVNAMDNPPPGFDAAGNYIGPVTAPTVTAIPPLPRLPSEGSGVVPAEPGAMQAAVLMASAAQQAQGRPLTAFTPVPPAGVAFPRFQAPYLAPSAVPRGGSLLAGVPDTYLLGFGALALVIAIAAKRR